MASRKQVTIDSKLVTKAVSALLTHEENVRNNESQKTAKKNLFLEDNIIQLVITIRTVPHKFKVKPIPIPLPNPLYDESAELCLFLKDSPELKAKIKAECENMKLKVITLSKLRANYKQYEDKRKLSASHDLFLTDESIITFLPKVLGKAFFKKKKQPVPIPVDKGSVSKAIENARKSTYLYQSAGSCISVRIARTNLTVQQIVENIEAAIPEIVSKISKKWNNVQSMAIKTTDSVALPFYNSLPTPILKIEANANRTEDSVPEGKEEAKEENAKETTKKRKKEADESPSGKKRKQETKEPAKEKEAESENKRKVEEKKEPKKNEKAATPVQKKVATSKSPAPKKAKK